MELYSKSYSKLLVKSKYCLRGDEENDDEDGPTDKIPPPKRQTISFAHETAPRTQNDWNKYFDTSTYEEDPSKRLKSEDNSSAPMNMMEARTISYRESMAKLFPNGQEPINPPIPSPSANPMMNFPGLKANNPLLMSIFQNKGAPEVPATGMPQMNRNVIPNNPLHNMNPGMANPAMGRGFPPQPRGQNYGMDPLMMMMYNKQLNQLNQMNMMNQLGQRGQPLPGTPDFHQIMMGAKDGGMGGMSAERMQAMMQNFQQYQMYQGGDLGIKAENGEGGWNPGDINVKVQVDDDDNGTQDNRTAHRGGNRRGDINVKDEESVN